MLVLYAAKEMYPQRNCWCNLCDAGQNGWNRVKASENLCATAVVQVAPVNKVILLRGEATVN